MPLFQIQHRHDTTENWEGCNPVLLEGEMGLEYKADGSRAFKLGDGVTAWNDLPYASGPKGADGEKGDTGPAGASPDHEWNGTELRFRRADGSWGQAVDLRGPKGDSGDMPTSPATKDSLGLVKIGKNLTISADGTLSTNLSKVAASGAYSDLSGTPSNLVHTDSNETITGKKTFTNVLAIKNGQIGGDANASSWDNSIPNTDSYHSWMRIAANKSDAAPIRLSSGSVAGKTTRLEFALYTGTTGQPDIADAQFYATSINGVTVNRGVAVPLGKVQNNTWAAVDAIQEEKSSTYSDLWMNAIRYISGYMHIYGEVTIKANNITRNVVFPLTFANTAYRVMVTPQTGVSDVVSSYENRRTNSCDIGRRALSGNFDFDLIVCFDIYGKWK